MFRDDYSVERIPLRESMDHLTKFLAYKTVAGLYVVSRSDLRPLPVPLFSKRVQPAREKCQQHVRHSVEVSRPAEHFSRRERSEGARLQKLSAVHQTKPSSLRVAVGNPSRPIPSMSFVMPR